MSIRLLGLNGGTDLNEIWDEDTLILEEGYRLQFTAIADMHTGGAADKS